MRHDTRQYTQDVSSTEHCVTLSTSDAAVRRTEVEVRDGSVPGRWDSESKEETVQHSVVSRTVSHPRERPLSGARKDPKLGTQPHTTGVRTQDTRRGRRWDSDTGVRTTPAPTLSSGSGSGGRKTDRGSSCTSWCTRRSGCSHCSRRCGHRWPSCSKPCGDTCRPWPVTPPPSLDPFSPVQPTPSPPGPIGTKGEWHEDETRSG